MGRMSSKQERIDAIQNIIKDEQVFEPVLSLIVDGIKIGFDYDEGPIDPVLLDLVKEEDFLYATDGMPLSNIMEYVEDVKEQAFILLERQLQEEKEQDEYEAWCLNRMAPFYDDY